MASYDNRSTIDRIQDGLQLFGRTRTLWKGKPHFIFYVEEKILYYCYIRKNACSAFKKLIVDHSNHPLHVRDEENPIDFILKYHGDQDAHSKNKYDESIFVYRDPIERMSSVFINKFVARNGNVDIFRDFESKTGTRPGATTYKKFIFDYVMRNPMELDPHVWPQHFHLRRIRYSRAIHMDQLFEEMADIIGEEKANKYFSNKVNSSTGRHNDHSADLSEKTSDQLHQSFIDCGSIPRHEQLAPQSVREAIVDTYAQDVRLYDYLQKQK